MLALIVISTTWRRLRKVLLIGSLLAIIPASSFVCSCLADHWHQSFASHYDDQFGGEVFTMLEKQHPVTGKICVLHDRYYQFFGSRRQFRVVQPLHVSSPINVRELLQNERISFVVAVPRLYSKRFAGFEEYSRSNPDRLHVIAQGKDFFIYRITQSE